MDKITNKIRAFINDKGGWKVGAICAFAGDVGGFANGAEISMVGNNVIFTTAAKWAPSKATAPTRVWCDLVKWIDNRCIFYMI